MIKTVYIDVVDTTNLVELANFFNTQEIRILTTGKTASFLKRHKINHVNVDKLDEFIVLEQAISDDQHPYKIDIIVVNTPDIINTINKPNISVEEVYNTLDKSKIQLLTLCSLTNNVITVTHPLQYDVFINDFINGINNTKYQQRVFGILQQFNSLMSQFLFVKSNG